AYPQWAVERAGPVVAVDRPELAHADGQLTVRPRLRLVDEDVERAVHRLDEVLAALGLLHRREHVPAVLREVAGRRPDVRPRQMRRGDDAVVVLEVDLAHGVLELLAEHPAAGVPDRGGGAHLVADAPQ